MRRQQRRLVLIVAVAILLSSITLFVQTRKHAIAQPPEELMFETSVKFLCGAIEQLTGVGLAGKDPPLNDGVYRTAINVLNPDDSSFLQPRTFTWKAVVDDGPITVFNTRALGPNAATEITCRSIRDVLKLTPNAPFFKGFVVIRQVIPIPSPPQRRSLRQSK